MVRWANVIQIYKSQTQNGRPFTMAMAMPPIILMVSMAAVGQRGSTAHEGRGRERELRNAKSRNPNRAAFLDRMVLERVRVEAPDSRAIGSDDHRSSYRRMKRSLSCHWDYSIPETSRFEELRPPESTIRARFVHVTCSPSHRSEQDPSSRAESTHAPALPLAFLKPSGHDWRPPQLERHEPASRARSAQR